MERHSRAAGHARCIQCRTRFQRSASRGGYYDICQSCVDGWPPEPQPRAVIPSSASPARTPPPHCNDNI